MAMARHCSAQARQAWAQIWQAWASTRSHSLAQASQTSALSMGTVMPDGSHALVGDMKGRDSVNDRAVVRRLLDEVVADYDERTLTSTLAPLADSRHAPRSSNAVAGFGPLQRHLDDREVEWPLTECQNTPLNETVGRVSRTSR